MITSIFKKSTPINSILITFLLIVVFVFYVFQDTNWLSSTILIVQNSTVLVLLMVSLFFVNFVVKKNGITRDSDFTSLFFLFFLLIFPLLLTNFKLIIANFFIILALRRLYSIQTLKVVKEKIFDASLYIFVASLFHFWSILFLTLVFVSIVFHVSRDYRNWFLPIVAFFAVAIIFVFYTFVFDSLAIQNYLKSIIISFDFGYFKNNYQNLALSIYAMIAVFFFFSLLLMISQKPLNLHAAFKKTIFSFVIGVIIFIISDHKCNEVLVFSFFPLAIMGTTNIEFYQKNLRQNIILITVIVLCLFAFFTQL